MVRACGQQICSIKTDSTGTEIGDPSSESHDSIGINRRQNTCYKLRPLSRALIMIFDHHATSGMEKIDSFDTYKYSIGISVLITFESISPKLESDKSLDYHNDDLMTTTVSAAI